MLKRLGPSVVTAGETTSPALFSAGLEFNPPAHGVWNIVHVGMLIPEAHQIYVCAINCMRGVVLTAAEMGARTRFSCVVLKEEDIVRGTVEDVTLEGISQTLIKLDAEGRLPPCVIVFPVCTHHFLGVSMKHVYAQLRQRFPGVDFIEAWMDPIMKRHRSPDQYLRQAMLDVLSPCAADAHLISHLGSDFPLEADSDLFTALGTTYALSSIHSCTSYASYKSLSQAALFIATFPNARPGVERAAKRLGRRYLYLPSSFDYGEITEQHKKLAELLDLPLIDIHGEISRCEQALIHARSIVGDTPICIDASVHPRPLGLARLLLEHGFIVSEVYLDAVTDEDSDALDWLRVNAPQVGLSAIVAPELRVAVRERSELTLALGQKAAWFCGTNHFVNMVEGGGLWGFSGIRSMAALMCEAMETEKDTRDLVPRKGLGCVSCI